MTKTQRPALLANRVEGPRGAVVYAMFKALAVQPLYDSTQDPTQVTIVFGFREAPLGVIVLRGACAEVGGCCAARSCACIRRSFHRE